MNKLKLDCDALEVQSFSCDEADDEVGTVHAREVQASPYHCKTTALVTNLTCCPCTPRWGE